METPSMLLQRAALRRHAHMAACGPSAKDPVRMKAPAISPRHTSSHASYTALMRSHDRVSTRHIAPRGGA